MTAKIPTVGTIIHGTLITHDLLIAFADVLERYGEDHPDHLDLSREAREVATILEADVVSIGTMTRADDILNELFDALDAIASQHNMHFSATEGDGSDFGFWLNEPNEENAS